MAFIPLITILVALGIFSQWLAWKTKIPAIVLLSAAGLALGPILGIANPRDAFSPELYEAVISLAVALILFEGAITLDLRQIRGLRSELTRLVVIGAGAAALLTTLAAYYILHLPLVMALVLGGLFIVTGPTVILPLLRQANLQDRIANLLKWEGILVDPLGALLALLGYGVLNALTTDARLLSVLGYLCLVALSGLLGLAVGFLMVRVFRHHQLPQFLVAPVTLVSVLGVFAVANALAEESGLLAVTLYGVVLANSHVETMEDIEAFHAPITTLLTSTVFVLLTASLSRDVLAQVLSLKIILFVLAMLFLVRPIAIFLATLATLGTSITRPERILLGWIAPRGIVALTVAGYFADVLERAGQPNTDILVAITFALVITTVCAHGFTLAPLARRLGLAWEGKPGLIIVGVSPFSLALADAMRRAEIPLLIVSKNYGRLAKARMQGFDTHFGEILHAVDDYRLSLGRYESLFISTDVPAYNALVATHLTSVFGRGHIFGLRSPEAEEIQGQLAHHRGLMSLCHPDADYDGLNSLVENGATIRLTPISEDYAFENAADRLGDDAILLGLIDKDGHLRFFSNDLPPGAEAGQTLITLAPPTPAAS